MNPSGTVIWTPVKLLQRMSESLAEKKIGVSPKTDAEYLVAAALGLNRLDLYLQYTRQLQESELEAIRQLLRRRFKHEPVAYILGETEFYGLKFKVGPGVLIPRKETELVVESAIFRIVETGTVGKPYQVLDFGTGTGVIAITLACECENLEITAIERQIEALEIAQRNIEFHRTEFEKKNSRITPVLSDGFEKITVGSAFDLIISNPPYISNAELAELAPEVKDWEPLQALSGGENGLDFYRLFADRAQQFLKPGGNLILEQGANQREAILQIFSEYPGWSGEQVSNDYAGKNRQIQFQKVL